MLKRQKAFEIYFCFSNAKYRGINVLEKYTKIKILLQTQLIHLFTDKNHQIQFIGYIGVFFVYLFTHLIGLIEYPSFSTDEQFYVLKALCWQKIGIPSMPKWGGEYAPEFTNPPTLSWIYLILFGIFGFSPLVVRLFMLGIGLLNLVIVFLIGCEIGGTESPWRGYLIGIIGGIILAFDQELIMYSRIGYLDNPVNLFLAVFIYFYLRYLRTEDQNYAWLAGVAAGIGLWFKLSALFILIGLTLFILPSRKINAWLRVQAMIVFFIGFYVLWGLATDPVAFVNENLFQIMRAYDANPIHFWGVIGFYDLFGEVVDLIRMLILFSFFIPIFYYKNPKNPFNERSFLVFCLFLGIIAFFLFTKTLYNYYFAGFASVYAVLFALSVFIAFYVGKFVQNRILLLFNLSLNKQRTLKQGIRIGLLIVFSIALILKYRHGFAFLSFQNQENLEIISYVQHNIPLGETLVAPLEIAPWLNGSGYSVYTTWLNAGTPDWVVREYIQLHNPNYLILHQDYLHISQNLTYYIIQSFTNYELYTLNSTRLEK
ncbi:MAG: ArnT family glycosyltransferase [Promethearchaeota archaeon]